VKHLDNLEPMAAVVLFQVSSFYDTAVGPDKSCFWPPCGNEASLSAFASCCITCQISAGRLSAWPRPPSDGQPNGFLAFIFFC
jgi:hypothetical protein